MLVPLITVMPPPARADRMPTPGAATVAPAFENSAIWRTPRGVCSSAATATKPSDPAGGDTPIV